ncbi:MAG TPA: hypothetical protein PLK29_09735 [Chiayiivirga sp.]|nr:hypothetical protein [Chiayiivirga sp.]
MPGVRATALSVLVTVLGALTWQQALEQISKVGRIGLATRQAP